MLRPYHRRAFVLLALLALEHGTSCAAKADGDSLWDLLSRTDQVSGLNGGTGAGAPSGEAPRRSLGPVPGFTLPDDDLTGNNDDIFEKPPRHSVFGPIGDWFSNLEKETGTKITARGHQTTSFQLASVSGSATEYNQEQYYGQGSNGLYNDTELDIDATLFKYLTYQTEVSNSPFHNPNDNRLKLDYNTKPVRVQYGDLNAGITGNSLIDFSRYMRGIEVTDNWSSHLRSTILYSETKATPQTIVIPGNGSTGPYYVYSGQIVDGSVQVRVDNKPMVQGSDKDYTLDPYSGELNFTNGNVILPTSTIAVSFETLSVDGTTGTIYGVRTDFSPRKGTSFGFEYVAQNTGGSTAVTQRNESLLGLGAPGIYTTDYPIDLSKPLIVQVNGVQQPPNTYTVNTQTGTTNQVFITVAVPTTVKVTFIYYPLETAATIGNRSVMGLDLKQTLGKLGSLTLETAMSSLNVSGSNVAGRAVQLKFDLTPSKGLHTSIDLKDIGTTFSSIQSPGFNQNEKSISISSEYDPTKKLHLSLTWEKAKRPDYSGALSTTATSSTGLLATSGLDDYNEYDATLLYKLGLNTTLNITRNSTGTNYSVGGDSTSVSNTISLNWSHKKVSTDISISSNQSDVSSSYSLLGLAAPTTGSSLLTTDSSTLSERVNLQYQASRVLSVGGSLSENAIKSNSEGTISNNNASDAALNASLKVNKSLNVRYNFDLSDTGNLGLATAVTTPTGTTTGTGTSTATGAGVTTPTTTGTTPTAAALPLDFNIGRFALTGRQAIALAVTRDVTTGTTTGSTVTVGSTSTTSSLTAAELSELAGGGTNSGLGTVGNYSGNLGASAATLGATSFGGKSVTNRISTDYHARKNLQLSAHIDTASSIGSYEYNSDSHGFGVDLDWQMSKNLKVHTTYETRVLTYTGNFGGSNTNTALATVTGKPFGGKLDFQMSYQNLVTNSAFATTDTTATTTTTTTTNTSPLTNTSMNLNSLNFRVDYPLSHRETLFTEMLLSQSTGYLANSENDISFGLDFNLTRVLKFSLGWQIISHTYANTAAATVDTANLNYRVSSVLAQFGFNF